MKYTYALEHLALPVSQHRVFATDQEVEDFLFGIAVDKNIPLQEICWNSRTVRAQAQDGSVIVLPTTEFGHSVIVALHELAHIWVGVGKGHGTEWWWSFYNLLREHVGIMAAESLRYHCLTAS